MYCLSVWGQEGRYQVYCMYLAQLLACEPSTVQLLSNVCRVSRKSKMILWIRSALTYRTVSCHKHNSTPILLFKGRFNKFGYKPAEVTVKWFALLWLKPNKRNQPHIRSSWFSVCFQVFHQKSKCKFNEFKPWIIRTQQHLQTWAMINL